MTCTKTTISGINCADDKVLKLYNKLIDLCDELNKMKISTDRVTPDDLICMNSEEFIMLAAFRKKKYEAKRIKLNKIHNKIFGSTFYDDI